ncbi:MAG: hypothetical protein U9Q91_02080 [Candidatus Marinimicrobia bacterium]|nr:hypothetical protein [Candidatus Neomarinimicrobiota bacterium]
MLAGHPESRSIGTTGSIFRMTILGDIDKITFPIKTKDTRHPGKIAFPIKTKDTRHPGKFVTANLSGISYFDHSLI